jgi:hypothetical protein
MALTVHQRPIPRTCPSKACEGSTSQQLATDIVQPEARAEIVELLRRFHLHCCLWVARAGPSLLPLCLRVNCLPTRHYAETPESRLFAGVSNE